MGTGRVDIAMGQIERQPVRPASSRYALDGSACLEARFNLFRLRPYQRFRRQLLSGTWYAAVYYRASFDARYL